MLVLNLFYKDDIYEEKDLIYLIVDNIYIKIIT